MAEFNLAVGDIYSQEMYLCTNQQSDCCSSRNMCWPDSLSIVSVSRPTSEHVSVNTMCSPPVQKLFGGEVEYSRLRSLLERYNELSDMQARVRSACSCSYFFWYKHLPEMYVRQIYEQPFFAQRLQV